MPGLSAERERFRPEAPAANLPERFLLIQMPFGIGKLPQACQQALFRTTPQGKAVTAAEEKHRLLFDPPFSCSRFDGIRELFPRKVGKADGPQRADAAAGYGVRKADRFAELHDPFRQHAGLAPGRIRFPQQFRRPPRPCGIVADPGQLPKLLRRRRQLAAVLFREQHGGFLQVPCTAVIAETLPQLQQPVLRNGSQRGDVRQRFQKPLIIGDHGFDPGLLQHDLSDPGVIGRRVLPPGEHP